MRFLFLCCATANEEWSELARGLYEKKISPMVAIEIRNLRGKRGSRDEKSQKKMGDSDAILAELKPDDLLVLFDETGKELNSREFSGEIQRILNSGKKRTLFVVGGAYGVDDRVKSRAHLRLSLSRLVMNHLVAETVALEQVYRGLTILRNLPYHND